MAGSPIAPNAPLFVVSPHLDDAVFGCGAWLAARPGSIVCTVCCAMPPVAIRTEWDTRAGFRDSTEAMHKRLREDDDALALLHATPVRLPFFDHQYGETPTAREIAEALADVLQQHPAHRFVMPLGLEHPDHRLTASACLNVLETLRLDQCVVYEEALYRALPEVLDQRVNEFPLKHPGFGLTRFDAPHEASTWTAIERKRAAIQTYRSQLPALTHLPVDDLDAAERFWMLARQAP